MSLSRPNIQIQSHPNLIEGAIEKRSCRMSNLCTERQQKETRKRGDGIQDVSRAARDFISWNGGSDMTRWPRYVTSHRHRLPPCSIDHGMPDKAPRRSTRRQRCHIESFGRHCSLYMPSKDAGLRCEGFRLEVGTIYLCMCFFSVIKNILIEDSSSGSSTD